MTRTARHDDLRFECTGCGKCCTGDPHRYWVEASRAEQDAIARHLRISRAWFRRRYVVRYADGSEGLTMAGGRCAFLDRDNRCRIYPVRPQQCRGYPYWPEIVKNLKTWRDEARRCEGIGRGKTIPIRWVRALTAKGK